MDNLTRISLITIIIGIVSLFFIVQSNMFILKGLNNLTEQNVNKRIELEGTITKIEDYGNFSIITLNTNCKVKAFTKNNISNLKNKQVTSIMTSQEAFPTFNIESLSLKQ
jgi:hypothetical protein